MKSEYLIQKKHMPRLNMDKAYINIKRIMDVDRYKYINKAAYGPCL